MTPAPEVPRLPPPRLPRVTAKRLRAPAWQRVYYKAAVRQGWLRGDDNGWRYVVAAALQALHTPPRPPVAGVIDLQTRQPLAQVATLHRCFYTLLRTYPTGVGSLAWHLAGWYVQEEARLRPPPLCSPSAAQEEMLYAPIR